MSPNLPPELNRLIAQELALGHYHTEEELLTEAVQLLRVPLAPPVRFLNHHRRRDHIKPKTSLHPPIDCRITDCQFGLQGPRFKTLA